MSIIPHRPPDTPLMQFYSTGKYEKPISQRKFKPNAAEPGPAARMAERNLQPHDEINVKAVNQSKFSRRHYRPDGYIKIQNEVNKIDTKQTDSNLTMNKVHNMKRDIDINRKNLANNFGQQLNQYHVGKSVGKSDFEKRRSEQVDSKRSSKSQIRSSRGKQIAESMLRTTNCENNYYKNTKHLYMTQEQKPGPYQTTMPDYFRIRENPKNNVDASKATGFDGTMTVVSRTRGWLTVTPKNKNRKKPVEKYGISGDAAKTSKLTPNWMQSQYPKNKNDPMHAGVISAHNMRAEKKRVYLVEKGKPEKAAWKALDPETTQHLHQNHNQIINQAQSKNMMNTMDWKENVAQQRFDKKVAGKIGSYHG